LNNSGGITSVQRNRRGQSANRMLEVQQMTSSLDGDNDDEIIDPDDEVIDPDDEYVQENRSIHLNSP